MFHCRNIFPLLFIASCAPKITDRGVASYYGDKFQGRKTASGETFKQNKLTAASRTIPFNTWVKIKNLKNKRTVKVRINDRGPFVKGRIIDVSKKAARKLGMIQDGITDVKITYKR